MSAEAPSIQELAHAVVNNDRRALARALTLVEKNPVTHGNAISEFLTLLPTASTGTWRIGITGPPGVGKSTLIENLGMCLVEQGKKVAVLAVDPSSKKTGGSILGDKVRMSSLSLQESAFIRPTASKLEHGGVAASTRNAIMVCEAAGYDVVIVETVGVGQGETEVSMVVDLFLLLLLPNSGDDVQGIKRGIMEMADAIVITKSDVDKKAASIALAQSISALRMFSGNKSYWTPTAITANNSSKDGSNEVLDLINRFFAPEGQASIIRHRETQKLEWFYMEVKRRLLQFIMSDSKTQSRTKHIQDLVKQGGLDPFVAAQELSNWLVETKKT